VAYTLLHQVLPHLEEELSRMLSFLDMEMTETAAKKLVVNRGGFVNGAVSGKGLFSVYFVEMFQ